MQIVPMNDYQTLSEDELITLISTNDEAAFTEIRRRLAPLLFNVIHKRVSNNIDARRILNQIFYEVNSVRHIINTVKDLDDLLILLIKVSVFAQSVIDGGFGEGFLELKEILTAYDHFMEENSKLENGLEYELIAKEVTLMREKIKFVNN